MTSSNNYNNQLKEVVRIINDKTAPREVKKKAWEELRASYRKEETYLITHYVSQIRNDVDYWDQSFEEMEESKREEAYWNERSKIDYTIPVIEYEEFRENKPEGMTDKEYEKKKKELRKLALQDKKERETDRVIEEHTPYWIFHDKVSAIKCECRAEDLRRGIYCKTCKLVLKVDKYMMELFKDSAQGRSPSHSLV